MLHSDTEFADRESLVPAKEAAKALEHSFSCHDVIEYLGFRPQAVNSAITTLRTTLQSVCFPQRLLEHCAKTHALVYVGEPDLFVAEVNRREGRLALPKRGVRSGFNFRFGLVTPGYRLVRIKPHDDTFDCNSVEQEYAIGHIQPGESVASAYVAAVAALGLHAKYGIDIVGEGKLARTSDNVGESMATLRSHGDGMFEITVEPDDADPDIGAVTMIEKRPTEEQLEKRL